jgi:L-threonylcarbamoyladenylate synthase
MRSEAPAAPTPSAAEIERAVARLKEGGLVAFPTETVYGLGADARNPAAVSRIFAKKDRPRNHPLIVHLAGPSGLGYWAESVPQVAERLIAEYWPGPLTLVLGRRADVPLEVTGGQDTVALRCPAHPVARLLLAGFEQGQPGAGLAAPSANRFGRISPTTAAHVREEFGESVMILDGGPAEVGIESTILDLSRLDSVGPVLLRPGAISLDEIACCLGAAVGHASEHAHGPRVSGGLLAHYAPRARLRLVAAGDLARASADVAVWSYSLPQKQAHPAWLAAPHDPLGYARELYAVLRQFDAARTAEIWLEAPPKGPAWEAIWDRLERAVAGSGQG